MKKMGIFVAFLLVLAGFVCLTPKNAFAEIEGYNISISCNVANSLEGTPLPAEGFTASNNTLKMDYSYFINGGMIYFSAVVEETEQQTEVSSTLYSWKQGDKLITESKDLVLYSEFLSANLNRPLIEIGTTRYTLTVKHIVHAEGGDITQTQDVGIIVVITDEQNLIDMHHTTSSPIPSTVNIATSPIKFYAKIPTTNQTSYSWLLKTPTNTNYQIVSQENSFTFTPSEIITNNGFGEYKIMVIGETTLVKDKKFYSPIYVINATPETIIAPDNNGTYNIKSKDVKNSYAQIEAFEYSITANKQNDLNNIEWDKLFWYVNGIKVAQGKSFIYEPTTTDQYKVEAKYSTTTGLSVIASYSEKPEPTGMYILYISIAVGIVVVGIILYISIKISNKKRDVVW